MKIRKRSTDGLNQRRKWQSYLKLIFRISFKLDSNFFITFLYNN